MKAIPEQKRERERETPLEVVFKGKGRHRNELLTTKMERMAEDKQGLEEQD